MGKKKGKEIRVENKKEKRKKGSRKIARIKEKGNFYKWRKGGTKERKGKIEKGETEVKRGKKE